MIIIISSELTATLAINFLVLSVLFSLQMRFTLLLYYFIIYLN